MRPGTGPIPSRIMIVGEAYGEHEERLGTPFVGASGMELNRMLEEVGISRSSCYITNVVNARPPNNDFGAWVALRKKDITNRHVRLRDRMVLPLVVDGCNSLRFEIEQVKPNVIVAAGNWALWALTGNWGIMKWRGSMLYQDRELAPSTYRAKVIPIQHPANILRQWEFRRITIRDLRRVAAEQESATYKVPDWHFILRPSFTKAVEVLSWLYSLLETKEMWLEFDLETRAGHIACAGISWSLLDSISIPFMCVENLDGYWPEEEEGVIVHWLYRVLTHPNARIRGQNLLYDCQYTYRHWHWVPRVAQDTMITHHTCFLTLPKRLDFQSSMYCAYHVYWKDDGKKWDKKMGEEQLWRYNCEDCVRTREVGEEAAKTIKALNLSSQEEFQQKMFWPVLYAMQRGVRVDSKRKAALSIELQEERAKIETYFQTILGHYLNPSSSKQLISLFYTDLGLTPIKSRAKKGVPGHVTCDDEALRKIAQREPILRPLVNAISDYRTLGVFGSTFLNARLSWDERMRSSFNICGTGTLRLSSSKDAFDSGANLQNIPSDKSKTMGKAKQRGMAYQLPNIRQLYIPDPGYTFFDIDLDRADLQPMVWETGDEMLKAALKMGADIHTLNAFILEGKDPPPLEELVESHPKYWDHRGPKKLQREFAKVFVHGTDYGGTPPTMAAHCGISVMAAERAQAIWFGAHPKIKQWQLDIRDQVMKRGYVENRFGYRWYIFDRPESAINEALAWGPQSTVACVINRIWWNFWERLKKVETLLQVHDSLAGQFPTHLKSALLPEMLEAAKIVIPYDDPLIIPVGIKTSDVSWGDCE